MIENKIQTEVKKPRRGLPRHTKNPFLNDTSLHTKTGVRRITTGKDRLAQFPAVLQLAVQIKNIGQLFFFVGIHDVGSG